MSVQQIAFRQLLDKHSAPRVEMRVLCLVINDLQSLKVAAAKYWSKHIAVANVSPSCMIVITKLLESTERHRLWFVGDNINAITRDPSAEIATNFGDMGEFIRYLLCHEHVKVSDTRVNFHPGTKSKNECFEELIASGALVLNEEAAFIKA